MNLLDLYFSIFYFNEVMGLGIDFLRLKTLVHKILIFKIFFLEMRHFIPKRKSEFCITLYHDDSVFINFEPHCMWNVYQFMNYTGNCICLNLLFYEILR